MSKLIGVAVTLFTYLAYTYMSTFVTQAKYDDDRLNDTKVILRLEGKVDSVLTGMCMMNDKTCKLNKSTKR